MKILARKTKRRSLTVRIVSLVTALSLALEPALGLAAVIPAPQKLIDPQFQTTSSLSEFALSPRLGEISYRINGNGDKTILNIQDAHCNYSAQQTISNIIKVANSEYGVRLVCPEGGAGSYDLSVFTGIEDSDVREKTADYFVRTGQLNGSEYFAVMNPDKVELYGLEEPKLYLDNLNIYRNSSEYRTKAINALKNLSRIMTQIKVNVYSEKMKDFDIKRLEYDRGTVDIKKYLAYLFYLAVDYKIEIKSYPHLERFINVLMMESKIDFKKANAERRRLVEILSNKLPKSQLKNLTLKTLAFKNKDLTNEDFYRFLFKKASIVRVDLSDYQELSKYADYIKGYEVIDKALLFNDIRLLQHSVAEKLFGEGDAREAYEIGIRIALMQDLFNFVLVKDKYAWYQSISDTFSVKRFIQFINKVGSQYNINYSIPPEGYDLDTYRKKVERFYQYSLERDDVFMKNLKAKMTVGGHESAVLITGGFHSENLRDLMRKEGYTYIEIRPAMKPSGDDNPYFNLLSGETNVVSDALISAEASTIQVANLLSPLIQNAIDNENRVADLASVVIVSELISQEIDLEGATVTIERGDGTSITLSLGERGGIVENEGLGLSSDLTLEWGEIVRQIGIDANLGLVDPATVSQDGAVISQLASASGIAASGQESISVSSGAESVATDLALVRAEELLETRLAELNLGERISQEDRVRLVRETFTQFASANITEPVYIIHALISSATSRTESAQDISDTITNRIERLQTIGQFASEESEGGIVRYEDDVRFLGEDIRYENRDRYSRYDAVYGMLSRERNDNAQELLGGKIITVSSISNQRIGRLGATIQGIRINSDRYGRRNSESSLVASRREGRAYFYDALYDRLQSEGERGYYLANEQTANAALSNIIAEFQSISDALDAEDLFTSTDGDISVKSDADLGNLDDIGLLGQLASVEANAGNTYNDDGPMRVSIGTRYDSLGNIIQGSTSEFYLQRGDLSDVNVFDSDGNLIGTARHYSERAGTENEVFLERDGSVLGRVSIQIDGGIVVRNNTDRKAEVDDVTELGISIPESGQTRTDYLRRSHASVPNAFVDDIQAVETAILTGDRINRLSAADIRAAYMIYTNRLLASNMRVPREIAMYLIDAQISLLERRGSQANWDEFLSNVDRQAQDIATIESTEEGQAYLASQSPGLNEAIKRLGLLAGYNASQVGYARQVIAYLKTKFGKRFKLADFAGRIINRQKQLNKPAFDASQSSVDTVDIVTPTVVDEGILFNRAEVEWPNGETITFSDPQGILPRLAFRVNPTADADGFRIDIDQTGRALLYHIDRNGVEEAASRIDANGKKHDVSYRFTRDTKNRTFRVGAVTFVVSVDDGVLRLRQVNEVVDVKGRQLLAEATDATFATDSGGRIAENARRIGEAISSANIEANTNVNFSDGSIEKSYRYFQGISNISPAVISYIAARVSTIVGEEAQNAYLSRLAAEFQRRRAHYAERNPARLILSRVKRDYNVNEQSFLEGIRSANLLSEDDAIAIRTILSTEDTSQRGVDTVINELIFLGNSLNSRGIDTRFIGRDVAVRDHLGSAVTRTRNIVRQAIDSIRGLGRFFGRGSDAVEENLLPLETNPDLDTPLPLRAAASGQEITDNNRALYVFHLGSLLLSDQVSDLSGQDERVRQIADMNQERLRDAFSPDHLGDISDIDADGLKALFADQPALSRELLNSLERIIESQRLNDIDLALLNLLKAIDYLPADFNTEENVLAETDAQFQNRIASLKDLLNVELSLESQTSQQTDDDTVINVTRGTAIEQFNQNQEEAALGIREVADRAPEKPRARSVHIISDGTTVSQADATDATKDSQRVLREQNIDLRTSIGEENAAREVQLIIEDFSKGRSQIDAAVNIDNLTLNNLDKRGGFLDELRVLLKDDTIQSVSEALGKVSLVTITEKDEADSIIPTTPLLEAVHLTYAHLEVADRIESRKNVTEDTDGELAQDILSSIKQFAKAASFLSNRSADEIFEQYSAAFDANNPGSFLNKIFSIQLAIKAIDQQQIIDSFEAAAEILRSV